MDWRSRSGRLEQVFTAVEVNSFVDHMAQLHWRGDGHGSRYHMIHHSLLEQMQWFNTMILDPINTCTGQRFRLLYAELLDCARPGNVHHDCKPLPPDAQEHAVTFLIPHSVDQDIQQCQTGCTFVFDQALGRNQRRNSADWPRVEPSHSDIFQTRITQASPIWHDRLSVQNELQWHLGDVLWWDSALAHASDDFVRQGHTRKQSIIFFTYL